MLVSRVKTKSPGLRPRACQNPGNSPQFLVTVPFGYWTPVLDSRRTPFMVSWGGLADELAPSYAPSNSALLFLSCSSINPEIDAVFIDFGSQNRPQIHPEITKQRFPNQSRNQTPEKTKLLCSRTLQTLKIELACRRGAIFHKTAVFEKLQNNQKILSKQLPKSLKNSKNDIQKSNQKTT